jgi:hypothetical protein
MVVISGLAMEEEPPVPPKVVADGAGPYIPPTAPAPTVIV